MKVKIVLIGMLALGCIVLGGDFPAQAERLQPSMEIIQPSLFGLHIHRAISTTPWPTVPFGSLRLWDTNTGWPWLEPRKGDWHFEALDRQVALAEKHHVTVSLSLGMSPTWASKRPTEKAAYGLGSAAEPENLDDWRNYVRKVATRYKGRIQYYEIWNEPNLKTFYTGNVEQMVTLTMEAYKVLKEVDPSAFVISPSATGVGFGWTDEFLAKGGGRYAHYIGYHFYVTPRQPEAMAESILKVKTIMKKHDVGNKQLWNTESGWYVQNHNSAVIAVAKKGDVKAKVLTDAETSAYIARAYIINWASGVQRFFWYAWDNKEMGLTEANGVSVKPSAVAYGQTYDWLVGSRMKSCISEKNTWICNIERENGYSAWIVWNQYGAASFPIPRDWKIQKIKDLNGATRPVPSGSKIDIGIAPLLLENDSK